MMSEEISSPPYPTDATNMPTLLRYLNDLRTWMIELGPWANETAMSLGATAYILPDESDIPPIPDMNHMQMLAINDVFNTLNTMRALRANWDRVVRINEECWESTRSVQERLQCVRASFDILTNAFILPEVREARNEKSKSRMLASMREMMRRMGMDENAMLSEGFMFEGDNTLLDPRGRAADSGKLTDLEFDALFHPPEEDLEEED